ncbi:MAG: hypothetical protein WC003_17120, partial [Terrimicrobiaceae bacterium]
EMASVNVNLVLLPLLGVCPEEVSPGNGGTFFSWARSVVAEVSHSAHASACWIFIDGKILQE